MDVKYVGHPNSRNIPKPKHLDEMIEVSKKLAKVFPFVRVDIFDTDKKFYLAEMAMVAYAGMRPYEPSSFDLEMGEWLDITSHADIRYVVK